LATGLWESVEHRGMQVDGFYQQFFARAPDAGGRQFWIDQFLGGATEEVVMASLMTTQEYLLNNPLNESFVVGIYRDLFDRAPDAAGQAFWAGELASGRMTPLQVATGLIDTTERHLKLVDAYYAEVFDRDPDPEGLNFWVGQLDQGLLDDAEVIEALFATPEYFNRTH
jgi:hypothetical protein